MPRKKFWLYEKFKWRKGIKGLDSGHLKEREESIPPIVKEFLMDNYRQSITPLAEKTGLHRKKVDRRVNQLEKQGIVRRIKLRGRENPPVWKSYEFSVKGLELNKKTGKWHPAQISEELLEYVRVNRLVKEFQKTGNPKILEEITKRNADIKEIFYVDRWLKDKLLEPNKFLHQRKLREKRIKILSKLMHSKKLTSKEKETLEKLNNKLGKLTAGELIVLFEKNKIPWNSNHS